jgi:hypothetical protein
MNKLLASSADPKQLSLTIKGALVLMIPLASILIKAFGGTVENQDLEQIVDAIADIAFFAGSIISLLTMFAGVIRKISNSFN